MLIMNNLERRPTLFELVESNTVQEYICEFKDLFQSVLVVDLWLELDSIRLDYAISAHFRRMYIDEIDEFTEKRMKKLLEQWEYKNYLDLKDCPEVAHIIVAIYSDIQHLFEWGGWDWDPDWGEEVFIAWEDVSEYRRAA